MSFEVNGKTYLNERAIATQQTGFTLVAQMRRNLPDAIGGIQWFGVDDANTCVYVPMYCSVAGRWFAWLYATLLINPLPFLSFVT